MNDSLLRINDLSRQSGVASSALRYYEEAGLLAPSSRTEAGYRLYDAGAVCRVGFIRRAKALGLTIREIQQLVREPADPATDQGRLRHAISHKLADTEHRIAELQTLRDELEALQARLGSTGGLNCGRVGDCECWLPTEKEVKAMATEACSCCDCTCPNDGTCTCCGCPSVDS
ncbi:MAG TPA: MerR family transcriptional regulator [Chloroflexota bacterium]|jgi:DNA-binding transcriptional MerR regulator|nr:MerR family transcriptional regulator [Chloroflexota bacterium]